MQCRSYKTTGLAVALVCALIGSVQAQQHQQHHPGSAPAPGQHATPTAPDTPAQPQMSGQMPGMMKPMSGMRGQRRMLGMGGMLQHHLEHLAQQLELTEAQRAQMWTLLSAPAKQAIRLRADVETLGIDLMQLLEAEPMDLQKVQQTLQLIAGKEAELRFVHISAMQELGKVLTIEQQQTLRSMRRSMLGHGDMPGHGGIMEHSPTPGHRHQRK